MCFTMKRNLSVFGIGTTHRTHVHLCHADIFAKFHFNREKVQGWELALLFFERIARFL